MDPITLIVVGGIIVAVPVAVVVIGARWARRGTRGAVLPRLVAALSMVAIVLVAVTTIVVVVMWIVSDQLTLDVPVIALLELPTAEEHAGTARVTGGTVHDLAVTVSVSGAPPAARAWLVAAQLVSAAVTIALLAMVAWFARQTTEATPFTSKLHQVLLAAGLTVAVGYTVTQILFGIAGSLVRDDLYAIRLPDNVDVTTVFSFTALEVDLLPMGIGLTIIVAAGLIRSGQRMQQDVKGLV